MGDEHRDRIKGRDLSWFEDPHFQLWRYSRMPRHARADRTILAMALIGYEAERTKIDATIREIQARLGHQGPGRRAADGAVAPAKRVLSVAARKRIGAAQKKRWAALKKAKAPKKHKLSAVARKS